MQCFGRTEDTPQKLDEGIILHGDTKVSDIKLDEYTGKVYNLITTDHTYVVNGLPVHDDIMEYNKHPRESMLLFEFLQNVLKKTGISKIREERDNNRLPQLLDQEWEMYDFEYNGEDTNNLSSFEKSVRKFFTDMPWLVDAADHLWKVRLLEVKNMLQTAHRLSQIGYITISSKKVYLPSFCIWIIIIIPPIT